MNINAVTAKEVGAALMALGFSVPVETLAAISRNCRNEFLEHLARCTTGMDKEGASRKYIGNLIRCLSPNTLMRVKSICPEATIDMIVPVAKSYPIRFLTAVDAANDPSHVRHDEAKVYLSSVLSRPNIESTPHKSVITNEPRQANVTSTALPSPEIESVKNYYSAHVYGSNAALCFNATDWNGALGVMVDAAMQTGPKSYDWRNATHIWLNTNEVAAVLSVFRRWRKHVEFTAHGAQNDKGFSIEFQDRHFFAKVISRKAETGAVRAVKILPADAMSISVLFLKQLAASYPSIPLTELLATVRTTFQDNATVL